MKSKPLSLAFVALIYLVAFGVGAIVLWVLSPLMHPLAALFIANAVATVVVFIFNLALKNASVYDPYWSVQPVFVIAGMYWRYGLSFQLPQLEQPRSQAVIANRAKKY